MAYLMRKISLILIFFLSQNLTAQDLFSDFNSFKEDYWDLDILREKNLPLRDRLFIGIRNQREPKKAQNLQQSTKELLRKLRPKGIILFRENFKDAAQTIKLIRDLKYTLGSSIYIGVDEEGGLVSRLAVNKDMGVFRFPNMESVSLSFDEHLVFEIGKTLAKQIRRLNINVDMAPVVDLKLSPDSPLLNRSFGSNPYYVGLLTRSFVLGLQGEGVKASAKHFPGLGGTQIDTHENLASLDMSLNELMLSNFIPFLFNRDAEFVMVGHVLLPQLSINPTSFSAITAKILRENLNIRSKIITDAFDMGAIIENWKIEDVFKEAVEAGIDFVLIPEADFDKINEEINNY